MARNGPKPSSGLISILCPTRHRPKRVLVMMESALVMAAHPELVEFIFYVDNDDFSLFTMRLPGQYKIRVGPRQNGPQNWNRAYGWSKGEIVMMGADDIVFRTQGWDDRVRTEFDKYPDGIVMVYAEDRPFKVGWPQATHPFLTRRWVDVLGYFAAPYFNVYWADQWTQELADRIQRKVWLEDVFIEHVHFLTGRAGVDTTYAEAVERQDDGSDCRTWDATALKRIQEADKLRQAIESFAG